MSVGPFPIYDPDTGTIIGYDNGSSDTPDTTDTGADAGRTGSLGTGADSSGAGKIPVSHYDLGDRLLIVYSDGSREVEAKGKLPAASGGSSFHTTQSLEDPRKLALDEAKQQADNAHNAGLLALQQGNAAEAKRQFDISQSLKEREFALTRELQQADRALAAQKFAFDAYNKASEQAANPRNWLETFFQRRGQQAPGVASQMGSTPYNLTNAPTSVPFEQFAPKFLQGLGLGGYAPAGAASSGSSSGVGVPLTGNAYNAAAQGADRVKSALGPGVSFASGNLGPDGKTSTSAPTVLGGQHTFQNVDEQRAEDPTFQNFRQGLATAGLGHTVTDQQLQNPKDVGPNGIPIFAKPGAIHLTAPAFLVDAMSGKKLALAGEAGPENVMFSGKAIRDPDADPSYVNPDPQPDAGSDAGASDAQQSDAPPSSAQLGMTAQQANAALPAPAAPAPRASGFAPQPLGFGTSPFAPQPLGFTAPTRPVNDVAPSGFAPQGLGFGGSPFAPQPLGFTPSPTAPQTDQYGGVLDPFSVTGGAFPVNQNPGQVSPLAPFQAGQGGSLAGPMTPTTTTGGTTPPTGGQGTVIQTPTTQAPSSTAPAPSNTAPAPVNVAPAPTTVAPAPTNIAPAPATGSVSPTVNLPSYGLPGTNVPGAYSQPNDSAPTTGPSHWAGLTNDFGGGYRGGMDPNSILGRLNAQGAIPPFLQRIIAQAQGDARQGTNTTLPWELPSDVPLLSKLSWNQLAPSEQKAFESFLSAYGIDPADYLAEVEAAAPHGMGESRFQPKFAYYKQ